ncbi:hypothetical protein [Paludisphaera rhizosphaerae]|uniref:hypothetical protein n=1 Tax=Paludisphaera rhizosphaerae TaxID=2711216 RepID=UPI0013EDC350|nr:hypothetical protein [Paludisphaera rhizosphaerae]
MNEFDRFLRDYDKDASHGNDEVSRVARHVLAKLEAFLGLPVEIREERINDGFLWAMIASPRPFAGALELAWRGPFCLVGFEGTQPAGFEATLFLYSGERRLKQLLGDKDHLVLEYVIEGEEGSWRRCGWYDDEHDEWSSYNRFYDEPVE